jgi:hypothetical protein
MGHSHLDRSLSRRRRCASQHGHPLRAGAEHQLGFEATTVDGFCIGQD